MATSETNQILANLFTELVDGVPRGGEVFILNSGDVGLLRSIEKLDAAAASRRANDGATIAAHVQHLRFGLSLMNRWASEGGNPFADAKWDEAWKISNVDTAQWEEIRNGFRDEARRWREALGAPRTTTPVEVSGMIGSVAHLAYRSEERRVGKECRAQSTEARERNEGD